MAKTLLEEFVSTHAGMRRFQQERAISTVTGLICEAMDDYGVNRAQLAERLGTTKGWVSQLLDGEANMTIRTIADVFAVLGQQVCVRYEPIHIGKRPIPTLKIAGGTWTEQKTWSGSVNVLVPNVRLG